MIRFASASHNNLVDVHSFVQTLNEKNCQHDNEESKLAVGVAFLRAQNVRSSPCHDHLLVVRRSQITPL